MKEFVEFLKAERLNRDVKLETVSDRSGISIGMLTSFEDGEFERFAASLLIRNTIRAYCKALHLEADPFLQKYSSQIESYSIQDEGIKRFGRQMESLRKRRRLIGLPLFVLVLFSAGAFWGGKWLAEKRARLLVPTEAERVLTQEVLPAELQERPIPNAEKERLLADLRKADEAIRKADIHIRESGTAVQGTGDDKVRDGQIFESKATNFIPDDDAARLSFSNSTEEAVADDKLVQEKEPNPHNKFDVEADDMVWIQVIIDEKKTLSEMLRPGDHREWGADKSMRVVIGNAGGVHMKWNEQPLRAPHDSGRVLRFRLPDYTNEVNSGQ